MASEQLDTIVQLLRANSFTDAPTIEEMRAGMDSFIGAFAPPEGMVFEPVDAGGVPAEWTRAAGSGDAPVVLYLHGGGYCLGSIATHRGLCGNLSAATGGPVLSVDYRLAPEHPHPAAVDDAVAAYRWLLAQGQSPAKVVIAGDSAGGGLTLATLIALRDQGVPLPAAAVPISPWTDMEGTGESMTTQADADPLVSHEGLKIMADAYVAGGDPRAPLASPLHADLAGLPPILIHVGGAETLLDDSLRFAERATAAGVDITVDVWPEMIHVWHAFAPMLPEAMTAIEQVGAFVRTRTGT
jgi:acetyl esterase/lipase